MGAAVPIICVEKPVRPRCLLTSQVTKITRDRRPQSHVIQCRRLHDLSLDMTLIPYYYCFDGCCKAVYFMYTGTGPMKGGKKN